MGAIGKICVRPTVRDAAVRPRSPLLYPLAMLVKQNVVSAICCSLGPAWVNMP